MKEKRKTTIKDAENEWKSNNIANRATDFSPKDEIEMYDPSEPSHLNVTYAKANSYQTLDSGYSGSNKSDNSDYEKLYKSNEYVDMSELTHHQLEQQQQQQQKEKLTTTKSKSSYQNFLQQFQNTNSSHKINAKLKIVSMRNINTNFNQSKGASNQNPNENSLSSSSSSSLISNNDKDNDFRDMKTLSTSHMIDDDYNYLPASYIQRQSTQLTNSRSNSRANSATSNARNKENLAPAAKTAAPAASSQQARKSVTFNNGSNVLEENTMFFYGNRSLDILDVKLEMAVMSQVATISFHFIDYDEFLAKCFAKIRAKFTSAIVSCFFC